MGNNKLSIIRVSPANYIALSRVTCCRHVVANALCQLQNANARTKCRSLACGAATDYTTEFAEIYPSSGGGA
jgi:hypothetical protein